VGARFIVREQMEPAEAFDRIYTKEPGEKGQMKRRIVRVGVPLASLAAVVVWLVASGRLGHKEPSGTLTLYGNVDIRQVELGFRIAGRIASMRFEEGEAVKAGAVMAELDPTPYADEARSAEAQVAAQAATLTKLEKGPRSAEIAQARANLAERKADMENARQSFERARFLLTASAISRASFDEAQRARDMAQARLAAAAQALRLLEEGSRAEDIAAARASLQAAQARLASAQTALADTRLRAPAEGVVLSRAREPGAIVSPSDIAYVLSLKRPVWVRAYVSEPDLGRIHPGLEVAVFSDSAPGRRYRGRIGFISPVAEFTPKSVETPALRTDLVYRLRIIIDEPDESLRQGMPVTAQVQTNPASAS
jgi:membrane fusion protein YbhG